MDNHDDSKKYGKKILVDMNGMDTVMTKLVHGALGYHVMIVGKMFSELLRSTACMLKESTKVFPNILTLTVKDPDSPSYPKGIIVRQTDTNLVIKKGLKRARRTFEAGLVVRIQREIEKTVLLPPGMDTQEVNPDVLRDCASATVVVGDAGYRAAEMANFKLLGITCLSLLLVSLTLLVAEVIVRKV